MRKILILLAVAMVVANANGCCCRRLCPWLDNGSCCCLFRQPTYTPVVAAPCAPACPPPCAPTYQQVVPQQYMAPAAATIAPQSFVAAPVAAPCAPACPAPCAPTCSSWDPCQCAIVAQPQAACCPAPQPVCCPAPQPMCCPAPQPVCYAAEPSCAYDAGVVGYGPSFGSCGTCDGCSSCEGGGCESGCCEGGSMHGGMMTSPMPAETILDPGPAAE